MGHEITSGWCRFHICMAGVRKHFEDGASVLFEIDRRSKQIYSNETCEI